MRDSLFYLRHDGAVSIQAEIRQMLVAAIMDGRLIDREPLPSSRKMARTLGVSRNTVVLAYQDLVNDGFLISLERSGFYVNGAVRKCAKTPPRPRAAPPGNPPDWSARYRLRPHAQKNISKPADWHRYPYPFIYGQIDQNLFPIAAWRECTRQTLGRKWVEAWTGDVIGRDDPMLVEQIRSRLLTRRGILAADDEILVTLGAQNALYILASLLITPNDVVAIEDPGYPDVRNIFSFKTQNLRFLPVDADGLMVDAQLRGCDYVYVTPSHQFPTTAKMSLHRRQALLRAARNDNFVIIEDDYEFETNYVSEPTPALKSIDRDGRVLYVGSLSKTLFPGLRLGFLVGPKDLIDEARALRRLMIRHPPNNNQRTAAIFMALGHHDAMIHRLHRVYRDRWVCMDRVLKRHLPNAATPPSFGGSAYWVRGPDGLDADRLAEHALEEGVIIEPGGVLFADTAGSANYFRLGFSSIATEKIEPGIEILTRLIERQLGAGRLRANSAR